MQLSVVIASIDASRSIEDCLRRLERACAGLHSELIVIDASSDDTAERVAAFPGPVTLVRAAAGTLAPDLWAQGYRRAAGRVIAFTTAHCLATPGWARALLDSIERDGATGAGGPLVLAPTARALDRAVYYLRYSAFMPETRGAGRIDGEIAGDNAAYRRDSLDRHAEAFEHGFWEIDFHRLLRADGGWIAAVPPAVMAFGRSFPAGTIAAHRFAHGMHFGAGRVAGGTRTAWQVVAAAPLVPWVLAARAGARVLRHRRARASFVTALPWFLVLAAAWAAGEAWGALHGRPLTASGATVRPESVAANRGGRC